VISFCCSVSKVSYIAVYCFALHSATNLLNATSAMPANAGTDVDGTLACVVWVLLLTTSLFGVAG
jgi:hypothetical protein